MLACSGRMIIRPPGLKEVQQVAQEVQGREFHTRAAKVAIVFDYESAWAWETQPQGEGFSYFRFVFEQYRALRRLGLSIDICPTDTADFSPYKLVLVPGLMYWKGELRQKLCEYRGSVMLGPRTGSKTVRLPAGLRLRQLGDLLVAVNYAPISVRVLSYSLFYLLRVRNGHNEQVEANSNSCSTFLR